MARHRLSLLIDLDPAMAKRELLAELKANGWSARATAAAIKVSWNAVKKWIVRLGLRAVVERSRIGAGLPARGGRPRGAKNKVKPGC